MEKEEIEERTTSDLDTLDPENHDEFKDPTSMEIPVCGQSTKRCELIPQHVEEDQTGTEGPVLVDQQEKHKIDFRVPGLSHAVVQAKQTFLSSRACKKDRKSSSSRSTSCRLAADNVNSTFSNKSKAMIRELGNVELFELFETYPKEQCSHCLLYWNQRIVYCTCGQFLVDSESRRNFHKLRLDALSIPNHVIKKAPTRCARHSKTEVQKEYHLAWNAWKRCCKKVDFRGEHFTDSRSISQRSSLS